MNGTKIEFNQILAFGNVQWGSLPGDAVTTPTASTSTAKSATLTRIFGDAEVGAGLADAAPQEMATQVAYKAEAISREWLKQFIRGDGSSNVITGLEDTDISGTALDG